MREARSQEPGGKPPPLLFSDPARLRRLTSFSSIEAEVKNLPVAFFFGPPATGKSFAMAQLARSLRLQPRDGGPVKNFSELQNQIHLFLHGTPLTDPEKIFASSVTPKDSALFIDSLDLGVLTKDSIHFFERLAHFHRGPPIWICLPRQIPTLSCRPLHYFHPVATPSGIDRRAPFHQDFDHTEGQSLRHRFQRVYSSQIPTRPFNLLLSHIRDYFPQPWPPPIQTEGLGEGYEFLILHGYLLLRQGFLAPHPCFQNPWLSQALALEIGGTSPWINFSATLQNRGRHNILTSDPLLGEFFVHHRPLFQPPPRPFISAWCAWHLQRQNPGKVLGYLKRHRGFFTRQPGRQSHMYLYQGHSHRLAGRPRRAMKCYRKRIGESPTATEGKYSTRLPLASLELQLSGPRRAITTLKPLLSGGKFRPRLEFLHGKILAGLGNHHDAGVTFSRLATKKSLHPHPLIALGALLERGLLLARAGHILALPRLIHRAHRLNATPPGYSFAPLIDLLQARYHLLKGLSLKAGARGKSFAAFRTVMNSARANPSFRANPHFQMEWLLLESIQARETGHLVHAATCSRQGRRIAQKICDREGMLQLRIEKLWILSRREQFQGPTLEKILSWERQILQAGWLAHYPSFLLAAIPCIQKLQGRDGAKKFLLDRIGTLTPLSFSPEKLRLFSLIKQFFPPASPSFQEWEWRERRLLEALPFTPLFFQKGERPFLKVSILGAEQFIPAEELTSLLNHQPQSPWIHLSDKKMGRGAVILSFHSKFTLGRYLRYWCEATPGKHSFAEIFHGAEGFDDFDPEEEGNRLRQYIKRVRTLLDGIEPGLGEKSLLKSGEGGYEFKKNLFIIIFG